MKEEILFGVTITVVFMMGLGFGLLIEKPKITFEENTNTIENQIADSYEIKKISESSTKLAAVNRNGEGILTDLMVGAYPGKGRVLVDVENLVFWMDTQQSVQKAKKIAEDYIGKKADKIDLIYTLKLKNGTAVGGTSAGAAFTIATIAALENRTIKNDAIITGTIEEDGKIGRVDGIIAKGKAAKEGGFQKFLVPEGQKKLTEYRKEKECKSIDSINLCNIEYRSVEIDVEKEVGIEVIETKDLKEALTYLL